MSNMDGMITGTAVSGSGTNDAPVPSLATELGGVAADPGLRALRPVPRQLPDVSDDGDRDVVAAGPDCHGPRPGRRAGRFQPGARQAPRSMPGVPGVRGGVSVRCDLRPCPGGGARGDRGGVRACAGGSSDALAPGASVPLSASVAMGAPRPVRVPAVRILAGGSRLWDSAGAVRRAWRRWRRSCRRFRPRGSAARFPR